VLPHLEDCPPVHTRRRLAAFASLSLVLAATHSKRARRLWKIGAIPEKIHASRLPPALPLLTAPNHFHHFALRLSLRTADSVGVDIHGAAAVNVAHQRLLGLHILAILSEKTEITASGPTFNMP